MRKIIKPPFSYQGGKGRVAGKIIDIIDLDADIKKAHIFHDFCSGSGAISIEVFNRFKNDVGIIMYDCSPMGLFYKNVKNKEFNLSEFEKEIKSIPKNKSEVKEYLEYINKTEFTVYKYLILQAGSFGGKQVSYIKDNGNFKFGTNSFRSYWMPTESSNRRSPVNPMMPMPETLFDNVSVIVENFKPLEVYTGDLNKFKNGFSSENIFYVDPPYEGTSGYVGGLNNNEFYKKFDTVYVSEYKILSDKYWIVSETNKGGINGNTNKSRVEILSKITK